MVAYKALKALANTEMTLFAQDLELRYLWLFNAEGSWLADAKTGDSDHDFLPVPAAEKAKAIKSEILKSGAPVRFELPILSGDNGRWFDVRVDVDRNDEGEIIGLIGTSVEITDQKRREDTLKTLLREVAHRSKNLLAIIQSLASQTARHSVTVPEFLVRFRGRIQSLASSQDIVTDTDWRGADLFSLVTMQVERYAPDGMDQIRFEGVDVYLSPTAALHVGLALHELAVNAASYGSLSVPGGRIAIASTLETKEGQTSLILRWQESNGPRVRVDYDPRFGTSTLERIVPNSVGGEARLEYRPDGIQYWLRVPRNQFELVDD
ncbi:PAS domain-containing sensor histidine kinase [Aureimonas sp. ME7]|uniref:sensor histidine kinase n=1 Tax=Aureimonas sp. ME7 TaxID=2744252 RepID=UPI0015F53B30|nr:PAS domain-containing sensor histidine kinase [Aureimonas sp. ME7]